MKKDLGFRFCTREPNFPRYAFVAAIWLEAEKQNFFYTLKQVFTNLSDMTNLAGELQKEKGDKVKEITDLTIIIPIKLERLFPMKPEYWKKPEVKFGQWEQMNLYTKMLIDYRPYKLVVTSLGLENGKEYFLAPLPVLDIDLDNKIDLFMKMSDHPVDETAKSSAVYSIGEPFGYNFKTGEIYQQIVE